jgi:hypothetical protein
LSKKRRDMEFLGETRGEQWLCGRKRPTELHRAEANVSSLKSKV